MRRLLPILFAACVALSAQTDRLAAAIGALQQGDFRTAEELLKAQLKSNAKDPAAFALLGVVFDQEKKYDEAERAYKSALQLDGSEPSLLNNYGNHLLAGGHIEAARQMFLRAVASDAGNRNANVQLAKLALEGKRGDEALRYLGHLSQEDRAGPDLELMFGIALSSAGRYGEAEEYFRRIAEAKPDDFEAQYDLGLAASKAKHTAQAQQALQRALELRPESADALYDLAVVKLQQDKAIEAIALLARGATIASDRADIQFLLAQSTARLGYFEDSIKAWDRYSVLKPNDDVAKRERAFAASAIGQDPDSALANLLAFTKKHPGDAMGHYELGTALSATDTGRAASELGRAIQLSPGLTAAHMARGLLSYRHGDNDAALLDFAAAAKQQPANARILDRLGETYLAGNHLDQALPILRKAAGIAPNDPSVLLHLGRALTKSGQATAAADIFGRYRRLDDSSANPSRAGGLVEFLSLPPGEQQARYRAGVERTVAAQPENVQAQVKYLGLLLRDERHKQAAEVCRKILELRPGADLVAEAGRALLEAGEYSTAEEFLKKGIEMAGSIPSLQLELAQARFNTAGAQAGIAEMNRIDQSARTAGYYTARAEMLARTGQ